MPKLNVAYTFLNAREKIHQFLSSIKKMKTKKWFLFLPHGEAAPSPDSATS